MKRAQDNRGIKDPAFRIPEGYFETLPERLQARIAAAESGSAPSGAGGKVVPLRRRHYRWTAAAAAIALLLGIGLAVRPDDRSEGFALLNDEQSVRDYLPALSQDTDRPNALSGNEILASYLPDEQQPSLIYWEQNDNLYALESADVEQYISDHYNIMELAAL